MSYWQCSQIVHIFCGARPPTVIKKHEFSKTVNIVDIFVDFKQSQSKFDFKQKVV